MFSSAFGARGLLTYTLEDIQLYDNRKFVMLITTKLRVIGEEDAEKIECISKTSPMEFSKEIKSKPGSRGF